MKIMQGDQLYMAVGFWYLVIYDLSSVRLCKYYVRHKVYKTIVDRAKILKKSQIYRLIAQTVFPLYKKNG